MKQWGYRGEAADAFVRAWEGVVEYQPPEGSDIAEIIRNDKVVRCVRFALLGQRRIVDLSTSAILHSESAIHVRLREPGMGTAGGDAELQDVSFAEIYMKGATLKRHLEHTALYTPDDDELLRQAGLGFLVLEQGETLCSNLSDPQRAADAIIALPDKLIEIAQLPK